MRQAAPSRLAPSTPHASMMRCRSSGGRSERHNVWNFASGLLSMSSFTSSELEVNSQNQYQRQGDVPYRPFIAPTEYTVNLHFFSNSLSRSTGSTSNETSISGSGGSPGIIITFPRESSKGTSVSVLCSSTSLSSAANSVHRFWMDRYRRS